MTVTPSRSELSSESDEEQELSRITVLVGSVLIDVGLPATVSVSAVVNDVIELANDKLSSPAGSDVEFDNTEGRWTFARLTGARIDPDRSLAEVGVYDGELLLVQQVTAAASSVLVDDVEGISETSGGRARGFTEHPWLAGWFGLSITFAVTTAFLAARPAIGTSVAGVPVAAVAALVVGFGFAAVAAMLPYRSARAAGSSPWLAGVALALIFGGSLNVVPDGHGVKALPMALALSALVAWVQLLISEWARALYTAVITLAVFGVPAALAQLLETNQRAVGVFLATLAVVVVYLAPRVTIMLSRLPVPRVPTAGEPLDDIETQGGTAVEGVGAVGKQIIPTEAGMADRVRRAREYLTGIVAAAAIAAVAGCYLADDVSDGFFWQGAAFAIAVATVLCLRGRSHHDLIQSAALIGGGMVIALVIIMKTATFVSGWQVNSAVALVTLTLLLVVCGCVAPTLEFSPVMRRRVELLEVVAIGLVFPLACWIIRVYAFFRELRI
jgi:type VII secretion integral membrane protein EccD